jgi:hypothetical protein
MRNISLKEMFEMLIDCILNKKDYPTFYYKRENEFIGLSEVDLLDSRFKTIDDDFSEYEWELEKSNIYVLEED